MILENLETKSQELLALINLTLYASFSVLKIAKENLEIEAVDNKSIEQAEMYIFTLDAVINHLKITSSILKKLDFHPRCILTKSQLDDNDPEKYIISDAKKQKNNRCTIFSFNNDIDIYVEKDISLKDFFR